MRSTEIEVVNKAQINSAVADALLEADIAKGTDLNDHTNLTTSAHGGIVANTDARLSDTRDPNPHGHSASGISTLPTGDVAATNVQQAISELDAEKQATSGKNAANGYMGLNANALAPPQFLGSGDRNGTRILRDDGTWVDPSTASVGGATEDAAGVAELATNAEVQTGTDAVRIVTPAGLSSRTATQSRTGVIATSTGTENQTGTNTAKAVTPAGMAGEITRRNTLEAVIAPTLVNSWVNVGGAEEVAGFYKDPFGMVHLQGTVRSGTLGATVFTLPAGYRPAALERFAGDSSGSTSGQTWAVSSAGAVICTSGANTRVSLSGMMFRAVN